MWSVKSKSRMILRCRSFQEKCMHAFNLNILFEKFFPILYIIQYTVLFLWFYLFHVFRFNLNDNK